MTGSIPRIYHNWENMEINYRNIKTYFASVLLLLPTVMHAIIIHLKSNLLKARHSIITHLN